MSESYIEFNYRMATLLTSLGWRVNPVYDTSNPRWKDKKDKKPIIGGRKQGEDGFPGTKPRTQASWTSIGSPGAESTKVHSSAIVNAIHHQP